MLKFGAIGDDKMALGTFSMNYAAVDDTCDRIQKLITFLRDKISDMKSEIPRLEQCTGTKENPHNHYAEISYLNSMISKYTKWAAQLETLRRGMLNLKDNTIRVDNELAALVYGMDSISFEEIVQNNGSIKVNTDGTVTLDPKFALSLGKGPIKNTMSKEQFMGYYEDSTYNLNACYKALGELDSVENNNYLSDPRYISLQNRTNSFNVESYKKEFVLEVFPILLEYENDTGIPLEIMFGQICEESAYGTNTMIDKRDGRDGNNYFGYQEFDHKKDYVLCDTHEWKNGVKLPVEGKFKVYSSMEESIDDYTQLLLRRYKEYTTTDTPEDWANALELGGYSTTANYGDHILGVAHTWRVYINEE